MSTRKARVDVVGDVETWMGEDALAVSRASTLIADGLGEIASHKFYFEFVIQCLWLYPSDMSGVVSRYS